MFHMSSFLLVLSCVHCTLLSSLFTQGYNSYFFFSLRSRCLILYLLKVKLLSSLFTQDEIALSFIYFSIFGMGEILRVRGYIHNILQHSIVIFIIFYNEQQSIFVASEDPSPIYRTFYRTDYKTVIRYSIDTSCKNTTYKNKS